MENQDPPVVPEEVPLPVVQHFICYDQQTGRIMSQCSVAGDTLKFMQESGVPMIEAVADPAANYVKDGMVVPKLDNPTVAQGGALVGLPVPCQIQIGTKLYDCNEERAELEFDAPGTYRVRVIAWPYLDKEFVFENPA
jgi:hypothetical protein